MKWHPIETAPSWSADQTAVHLWFPEDSSLWTALPQGGGGWCGMDELGLRRDSKVERRDPTHWSELPKPPKTASDEGRRRGGLARAASLSPERRAEIAQNAARARWGKKD